MDTLLILSKNKQVEIVGVAVGVPVSDAMYTFHDVVVGVVANSGDVAGFKLSQMQFINRFR